MSLRFALTAATTVHVPVIVWGPPGVGKSAAVQRWAAARGLACWTVIASLRDPSDFAGLPVLSGEPRPVDGQSVPSVGFAPPRFAVEAARQGGVIFLDELTTAPPAVQAALLRAVLDAAFGDLQLPRDRVAIVAAANPPELAAGGWDLAAPLANRFLHHSYMLEPEAWVGEFPGYWGAPPVVEFQGQALDAGAWGQARSLVAAFVRARPALLLQIPADESRRGQAWPSPRSWDFASRLLAAVRAGGGTLEDALPLCAGCLGDGPAIELLHWIHELDLPDPEMLLAEPQGYQHPARTDRSFAILSAVVQAAVGRLTRDRWLAAWRILGIAAAGGGADVAAAAARRLALARRGDLPLPAADLAAFLPVLQAAGLVGGRA
ncbi:MAG: AAA family ATPase [Chloroflexi bacterium]|nr:AAA family ATPase [Chloroflexota bacterium]